MSLLDFGKTEEKTQGLIEIVGNTVLDNLKDIKISYENKILVTMHRRENIDLIGEWFQEINGMDRSERFLNYLYRCGNVIVRRHMAKISRQQERNLKNTIAADIKIEDLRSVKREIPWNYDFISPLSVDVKNGSFNTVGKPEFVMSLNTQTVTNLINLDFM